MRSTGKSIVAAVAAAIFALPSPAISHENLKEAFADCTCISSHKANQSALAIVVKTEGGVVTTGANGYQNVTVGMSLADGSEITTDPTGSARVSVGRSCDIDIGPSEQVVIFLPAGHTHKICVIVGDLKSALLPDLPKLGLAIQALIGFGLTSTEISGGDYPASN